jgi:hypothetical protein
VLGGHSRTLAHAAELLLATFPESHYKASGAAQALGGSRTFRARTGSARDENDRGGGPDEVRST